jgi:hypothetical protein
MRISHGPGPLVTDDVLQHLKNGTAVAEFLRRPVAGWTIGWRAGTLKGIESVRSALAPVLRWPQR